MDQIRFCPYCSCTSVQARGENAILCPRCGALIFVFRSEDNAAEEWRDVPGFEGDYQVSTKLRVRSLDRKASDGRKLPGQAIATYYKGNSLYCTLYKDGRHKEHNVLSLYLSACKGQRKGL